MAKSKKARDQSGPRYPHATVAFYGPDNKFATKAVVAVFDRPSEIPTALQRWEFRGIDLREDSAVAQEIVAWMQQHEVAHSTIAEEILGCPHESGVDYPATEVCPFCDFWKNRPRRQP